MNYIYSECFSPIFFAEYEKDKGQDITLITNNLSIRSYCAARSIECIFIIKIVPTVLSFYKLFSFKKNIKNVIHKYKINNNDKFYIFDNSFILQGFYFCRLLRKQHNVFYYETIEINSRYKQIKPLKTYLLAHADALFYKIFLGINTVLLEDNNNPIIGIDKRVFFKKNNINISPVKISFIDLKMEVIKFNIWKLQKFETMFVDIGSASGILVENYLQSILKTFVRSKNEIVIKEHPSFANDKLFDDFEKYPKYIPAEYLLENITRNVISLFSTTLLCASRIERLNAISLIDLVTWKDVSYKLHTKKQLQSESGGRIIFIQTIDELETYI